VLRRMDPRRVSFEVMSAEMDHANSKGLREHAGSRVRVLAAFRVRVMIDAHSARRGVRACAGQMGFDRIQSAELTIVASELCTNIVKYGVRGTLHVEHIAHPVHGIGVLLDASDEGPSFRSFEKAVRDRSDDRGTIPPDALNKRSGIAAGLGAVQRLTHLLWMEQIAAGQKSVIAVRYVKSSLRAVIRLPRR
jgi:anti-sigma regulatory factor (Ser/Thr protein kinase)